MQFFDCSCIYEARMNPALNGSSAIRHFEHSNAIEMRDRIIFDFYTGLSHMYTCRHFEPNASCQYINEPPSLCF